MVNIGGLSILFIIYIFNWPVSLFDNFIHCVLVSPPLSLSPSKLSQVSFPSLATSFSNFIILGFVFSFARATCITAVLEYPLEPAGLISGHTTKDNSRSPWVFQKPTVHQWEMGSWIPPPSSPSSWWDHSCAEPQYPQCTFFSKKMLLPTVLLSFQILHPFHVFFAIFSKP